MTESILWGRSATLVLVANQRAAVGDLVTIHSGEWQVGEGRAAVERLGPYPANAGLSGAVKRSG